MKGLRSLMVPNMGDRKVPSRVELKPSEAFGTELPPVLSAHCGIRETNNNRMLLLPDCDRILRHAFWKTMLCI